jgi:hypothetical protein
MSTLETALQQFEAPIEFIGRYMKGWFELAIADELHQLAGSASTSTSSNVFAAAISRAFAMDIGSIGFVSGIVFFSKNCVETRLPL